MYLIGHHSGHCNINLILIQKCNGGNKVFFTIEPSVLDSSREGVGLDAHVFCPSNCPKKIGGCNSSVNLRPLPLYFKSKSAHEAQRPG